MIVDIKIRIIKDIEIELQWLYVFQHGIIGFHHDGLQIGI